MMYEVSITGQARLDMKDLYEYIAHILMDSVIHFTVLRKRLLQGQQDI